MCGIAGFVDYTKATDREILNKMTSSMAHRGPDGEGYSVFQTSNASIGLGHRRLSIIDLTSGGKQPFNYDCFHITYNGEVYNYAEIKVELAALGHVFKSHSDTEVIIHAYAEWGQKCLQKFIGMFAFVIYDVSKNEFFGARDRIGVKPFFYYKKDNLFIFSSELKGIIAHPKFNKTINIDAAAAFMQYGYVPAPHCIFKDTFKLKPGYYFTLNLETKSFKTEQYWSVYDAYNKPELKINFEDAQMETESLLKNAFEYRMVSDVPVGVFLSGGYDSTCVTALLQKERTSKLKTFTIGMPDAGLNEAPAAKEIAERLGTDHTEFYCTEKEAVEIIIQLPLYFDEPFGDSSAIPTMLVSRIAREKVTVSLSADGGDEIFAGYSKYEFAINKLSSLKKIPSPLRRSAFALMNIIASDKIPFINKSSHKLSKFEKLKNLIKDTSERNFFTQITMQFNNKELNKLFINAPKKIITGLDSAELKEDRFSFLNYMMAIDFETYLPDDILQKVDRAGMSVSLEGREPFLDHRIIEWAAQLPMDFKYNNGKKKFIIKQIVHKYLPEEMMNRPKMGFGIPISKWLKNNLKPLVEYYLDIDYIKKQGIFKPEVVNALKNSFYGEINIPPEKIWYLLMFQMWYDKWMLNTPCI